MGKAIVSCPKGGGPPLSARTSTPLSELLIRSGPHVLGSQNPGGTPLLRTGEGIPCSNRDRDPFLTIAWGTPHPRRSVEEPPDLFRDCFKDSY